MSDPKEETDLTDSDTDFADAPEECNQYVQENNAAKNPEPEDHDENEENAEELLSEEMRQLNLRKEKEELMSLEELEAFRDKAQALKGSGNDRFKEACFTEAIAIYTEGISICPLCYEKERSVLFSNRAACYLHTEQLDEVITDCTDALKLNPVYSKALKRRAEVYEKKEKLDEALEDYKKLVELEPSCHEAKIACQRLPGMINERNEKMKAEMFGKLKDLGNMVLKPFGLSTENFNFVQDPTSGGYSVNFNNS